MFDREGGAFEILRVCRDIIKHQDRQVDESKSAIQNVASILLNNATVGVLQSIGYKEFFEYVTELLELVDQTKEAEWEKLSIKEQIACLFEAAMPMVSEIVSERANGSWTTKSQYRGVHQVIEKCISKLTASTLLLTKKQRRYLKNRLLPRLAHCDVTTYMINSVDEFFAQLPIIKERIVSFLADDKQPQSTAVVGDQLPSQPNPQKSYHRCEVCDIDLVGDSMWSQHSKSKSHKFKYGKMKKRAANFEKAQLPKQQIKKIKNKPVASIFDDEESSEKEETENTNDPIEDPEQPSGEHKDIISKH